MKLLFFNDADTSCTALRMLILPMPIKIIAQKCTCVRLPFCFFAQATLRAACQIEQATWSAPTISRPLSFCVWTNIGSSNTDAKSACKG